MVRALFLISALAVSACGHRGALENAQTSVLRNPSEVSAWVALGDAYRRNKDPDSAAKAYQRALSLDPGNEQILRRIGEHRSSAARELELQVLANPEDDELWGDLGDVYAEMGDQETALRHYRYALSLDPDDNEWQRKVMELAGEDDLEELIRMMQASTNDEQIGDLADRLRSLGREQEACEHYFRALGLDPGDNEWVTAVATCPGGDDIHDRVVEQALASGDDERIGDAGDLLQGRGDTERACELYRRALALDPADTEWVEKVGRCDGGGFQPYEGVEAGPGGQPMPMEPGSDSLVALGRSALASGDRTGALQHFEAALLQQPTDRDARVGVMSITGHTLIAVLEELSTQRSEDDELWGDLGDAYLEAARKADAIRAYQRAESLDPDDFEWQSKLDVLEPSRMGGR